MDENWEKSNSLFDSWYANKYIECQKWCISGVYSNPYSQIKFKMKKIKCKSCFGALTFGALT